jgi:hypothetical protein
MILGHWLGRMGLLSVVHLSLLTSGTVGSGWAEPIRDAASGLAADPPPGYTARIGRPQPGTSARIDIKRPDDSDMGCSVGFGPLPENAHLDQAKINAITSSSAWLVTARTSLALLYDVRSSERFEHAGVQGAVIIADFKPRPDLPARSQEIRTALYVFETPKGRVNIACVGERATFDARRREFDAVARGTLLPR